MERPTGDDSLQKLEYLSLVSKVCSELEAHFGSGEKVLAEFITELGGSCETVEEFDSMLKENGAEMPDYFVRTLLTIIHAILPPKPKSDKDVKKEIGGDGKKSKFNALSIADGKGRVEELKRDIEEEARERCRENEESEEKYRPRDRDKDRRSREGDRRDRDGYRDISRDRDGRDMDRDWHRDRDYDDGDRSKKHKDRDGRDRSRNYDNREENGADRENREDGDRRSRLYRYNEPELYKVYKGRVSRVMDTGCFVQLSDFKRKEGLVHVSQLATRRIGNAKDVVKRDQEVYVKVISLSGQKLSLSMRDVDQNTGKDLLP